MPVILSRTKRQGSSSSVDAGHSAEPYKGEVAILLT
jgi:hypothetical protein